MEGFHALLSLHGASKAAYKAASGRGTERSPVHIQVLPLVQPLRKVCQQQPQPAGTHTDQVGGEQSLAGLMPEIQTAGSRLEQQPGPTASTTKSHRSGSGRPRSTMGQCAKSSSMRLRCCQAAGCRRGGRKRSRSGVRSAATSSAGRHGQQMMAGREMQGASTKLTPMGCQSTSHPPPTYGGRRRQRGGQQRGGGAVGHKPVHTANAHCCLLRDLRLTGSVGGHMLWKRLAAGMG